MVDGIARVIAWVEGDMVAGRMVEVDLAGIDPVLYDWYSEFGR